MFCVQACGMCNIFVDIVPVRVIFYMQYDIVSLNLWTEYGKCAISYIVDEKMGQLIYVDPYCGKLVNSSRSKHSFTYMDMYEIWWMNLLKILVSIKLASVKKEKLQLIVNRETFLNSKI